jgi:glycosyltransferase involved in cell wall biosynthesis
MAATTIEAAIRSVLAQTFSDFELLVLDDGSTDGTLEIVRRLEAEDPRVVTVALSHQGLVPALNHGIDLARAPYIARMDADDICLPERFEKQVAYLESYPECTALGTAYVKVAPNGRPRGLIRKPAGQVPGSPLSFPPRVPHICHPTAMIRTEALQQVGKYRPEFEAAEDLDLWWRLSHTGQIHVLGDVLLHYTVYSDMMQRRRRYRPFVSCILGTLSAIAARHDLDDSNILRRSTECQDAFELFKAYEQLIGDRYPVRTYWLWYVIKRRGWAILGLGNRTKMLQRAVVHVVRSPLNSPAGALLKAILLRGVTGKELAEPSP